MRWQILLTTLTCALVCVKARTATRQPAVTAQITSLNDKDAKRKAMEHPAFANAGRQAGVEIWRIEDFNPVPVKQADYGKFYSGDSYIVLKTNADKRNNLSWDIHYWLGSGTSQDEAGAAAILTVGLDDKFNGAPVQHRETQGYESALFLGYFKPAIRYMEGGHATGFHHVTTNAGAAKRLFQVKGKKNVRVRQVDPLISSMNKGDCFILDNDQDILIYVGEKAKNVERLKAISVANQIRDQDHNGRGKVEIIDSYSSETDVQRFFDILGSGSRDTVPEDTAGGDDQNFERSEEQTVTLSEISDKSGSLKITPLPKPFRQEQLNPEECYILDTVSGSIYVWVGKQATQREKTEAMNKAQQYLTSKNYPKWVHVSRIPQGTEPAAFKQYFSTWRDVGMTHSRLIRSASDEDADFGPRLYEVIVSRNGRYIFSETYNFKQDDLGEDEINVLDVGDKIYVWYGNQIDEKEALSDGIVQAFAKYRSSDEGNALKVNYMKQGKEMESFMKHFGDWDQHMWIKNEKFINDLRQLKQIETNEI